MTFTCTCGADQKPGIRNGVHDYDCDSLRAIYPEIHRPAYTGEPKFPKDCPICGTECGGRYIKKVQIQNHTDKWVGKCKKNS